MPGFEIFGDEERREVEDVLSTGVLFRYGFEQARQGHFKVRTFEKELAKRLGAGYAHLCASGTAALSIALSACGVGAADEVVVPPFTFVATIEALFMAGAVPVFAEIDETLCLDPERIEEKISPRTRAVIVVHMCGGMARIDEIYALCQRRNLVLIEDACQAVGAAYKGRALGTFGRMGCFSFDPVKTITCGEGGAVVTDDAAAYTLAAQYADHGHDHMGADRGADAHPIIGANYRISELGAAVGLAQLRKLDAILLRQRQVKERLRRALSQVPAVTFRRMPDATGDSATFLSFFLPDEKRAQAAAAALAQAGVDGCFYWYANSWHYVRNWHHFKTLAAPARLAVTTYGDIPDYAALELPRSDAIMGRLISMQIKLAWSDAEVDALAARMISVLQAV